MSGYIGTQPVPQATQTRDVFTATSGQTSFATSGYTPNFLDVWLNGVKLVNGDDFTATNGSDVVLTSGAAAGDTVEVLSYSTFEVNSQTFTGTTTLTGDLQATTATFSGAVTGTSATLSGGVYLGGTGAANLLDDYEEGTWTPNVGGTATYNNQSGRYTKIGNKVFFECTLLIVNIGTGSTSDIGGLPFAANSFVPLGTVAVGFFYALATNVSYLSATIDTGGTNINLRYNVAGGGTNMGVTPLMGNGTQLYLSGQYSV